MSRSKLSFRELAFESPAYFESIKLRDRILRKPLGLQFKPEDLAREGSDYHLALMDENAKLIACLVLTPIDKERVRMRQVAVEESAQGRGIGRQLVEKAESFARKKGYREMSCHARSVVLPFYLKMNYKIVEGPFTEVGIEHYKMSKKL